jgi:CheY-like chemotaxis protein
MTYRIVVAVSVCPARLWTFTTSCKRAALKLHGIRTASERTWSRRPMANVLIVDDNSDTVELSADFLESAGHRVTKGRNGEEGLKSLLAAPLPDCVVLDVDMPVLGGPEMAHRMLLHDAGEEKIPIVLVSGRSDLPDVARRIGTPYFLRKATHEYGEALLKLVGRALSERQAPAAA